MMMRSLRFAFLFVLGVLATSAAALSGPARAADVTAGAITVSHPWSTATPGTITNGIAFLTITNGGSTPGRLVSAATSVAASAQLHTHLVEDGVMKMRAVDGIDIAPGATVELKPGGLHVMLMGLKAPLQEGQTYPLTLTFEKAGAVTVEVTVEAKAGQAAPAMNMNMDMGHAH